MADNRSFDPRFTPMFRLSSVRFLTFTSEEIKKMSCKRITNPNTFDSLLHPNPGGLHDPALGPCDKQELCGTCGLNYVHCPGHIGHIILPLSVFHPIFFQNLYKILRGSCFVCSRFLCTQYKAQVIKGQIALLDRGLVSEALELESCVSESLSESDGEHTIVERTHSHVQSCLERISGNRKHDGVGLMKSKHLTDMRKLFINEFFECLNSTKCPHCEAPVRTIRQDSQSKVIVRGLSAKLSAGWRAAVRKHRPMESSDTSKIMISSHLIDDCSEQHLLTPLEAKSHLRAVWRSDPSLVTSLFSCLKPDVDSGGIPNQERSNSMIITYPVDMFFVDVITVPPSRFRPVCLFSKC